VPDDLVPKDLTAATAEERDAITDWVDATVGEFPVNYSSRLVIPGYASLWDHELQRIRATLDPSSPNGEDTPPPIPAPSMPLGTNLTPRS